MLTTAVGATSRIDATLTVHAAHAAALAAALAITYGTTAYHRRRHHRHLTITTAALLSISTSALDVAFLRRNACAASTRAPAYLTRLREPCSLAWRI